MIRSKGAKDQCGTWQEAYSQLHSDILAGHAAQKYLIVYGRHGLADCLVSLNELGCYRSVHTDRSLTHA